MSIRTPQAISNPVQSWVEESTGPLYKIGWLMLCVGGVISAVNLWTPLGLRPGGLVVMCTGGVMLLLLRWGRARWAAQALCFGLLAYAGAVALQSQGLYNPSWLGVPIAVLMSGWMFGKRSVALISALGCAEVLWMLWLHMSGYEFPPALHLARVTILLITATVVAGFLGVLLSESLLSQFRSLQVSQVRMQSMFDGTHELIWTVDPQTYALQSFNASFKDYLQRTRKLQACEGLTLQEMAQAGDVAQAWRALYTRALSEKSLTIEAPGLDGRGTLELMFNPMTLQGEVFSLSVFARDVTELKSREQKIQHLAFHDLLTGLPNRTLMRVRLGSAITAAQLRKATVGMLYLDLDRFKHVNTTYSHIVGDQLLMAVSGRLMGVMRPSDSLCRINSNLFAVIVEDVSDRGQVDHIAAALQAALTRPLSVGQLQLQVSCCVGAALLPLSSDNVDKLMLQAETALKDAKQAGPGSYRFFEMGMALKLSGYIETFNALRQGLENHELVLYYQPQLDIHSRQVVGLEALVHWSRPGFGLVPLTRFMDVAQDSGLMPLVTRWALYEACNQAAAWRRAGMPALVVAVNIASQAVEDGQFEQDVKDALRQSQLVPTGLALECPESLMFEPGTGKPARVLQNLQVQGVQLVIDHFGAGQGSLAGLKQLGGEQLKIDAAFITQVLDNRMDQTLVRAVVEVAHSQGVRVTALGIESVAQLELVRSLGCDGAQGDFLAKPLSVDECTERLKIWQTLT